MIHWLLGTNAIQTPQVFDLDEPILLVGNDADDDLWQLIGTSDADDDGKIAHLYHAVDEDATLLDVLDLAPGEQAVRGHVGGEWTRGPTRRTKTTRSLAGVQSSASTWTSRSPCVSTS